MFRHSWIANYQGSPQQGGLYWKGHHESLSNVTPADVYLGLAKDILRERETIKKQTIEYRRLQHQRQAA